MFSENPETTSSNVVHMVQKFSTKSDKGKTLRILSFSCKNIKASGKMFEQLQKSIDIFLIQELWLFDYELTLLTELYAECLVICFIYATWIWRGGSIVKKFTRQICQTNR